MFAQRQQQWVQVLADPVMGPMLRLQLLENGSEFKQRRVLDAKRLAISIADDAAVLIGPDVTAAQITAGSKRLRCPEQQVIVLEQLNYWYEEAAGGTIVAAVDANKLKLEIDGEQLGHFPEFALSDYHRGDAALRFGAIPLGIVAGTEQAITLTLTPSAPGGGGTDVANVYVSLVVRLEPRWLFAAAGIVEARN